LFCSFYVSFYLFIYLLIGFVIYYLALFSMTCRRQGQLLVWEEVELLIIMNNSITINIIIILLLILVVVIVLSSVPLVPVSWDYSPMNHSGVA